MNENYVKPTTKQKYIEVEMLNVENVESFRKEIADLEIHNKLDDTCHTFYNVVFILDNCIIIQVLYILQRTTLRPNKNNKVLYYSRWPIHN